MKKLLLFLISILLLSGCAPAPAELDMEDDSPLVTAEGKTIMTALDYNRALIDEKTRAEIYGTTPTTGEDLFKKLAEYRILAYLSKNMGVAADKDELNSSYDLFLHDINNEAMYADDKEYIDTLRRRLGLKRADFKEWFVNEEYILKSAQNLYDDVARVYINITDSHQLDEYIRLNLIELASISDIKVFYPGMEDMTFTFEGLF